MWGIGQTAKIHNGLTAKKKGSHLNTKLSSEAPPPQQGWESQNITSTPQFYTSHMSLAHLGTPKATVTRPRLHNQKADTSDRQDYAGYLSVHKAQILALSSQGKPTYPTPV